MKETQPVYVLDSSAIIAYFEEEDGASQVEALFEQARNKQGTLLISAVQFGEVAYITELRLGKDQKEMILRQLKALQLKIISATEIAARKAAEFKARGGIAYPDCFAIAVALEFGGKVVTKDKEFLKFKKEVPIEWIG